MRQTDNSVKAWINKLDKPVFTFEEMQKAIGGAYYGIQEELFSILLESKPIIKQIFENPEIGIQFKKVEK